MSAVELSAGTVEYQDTGGDGPAIVFSHGLVMDGSLWRDVVADLASDHRCLLPTLPLGAHRRPMDPDADLSMRGIAGLIDEFIQRLDLRDVTLAMNDWGGPLLLLEDGAPERIGRVVITSCEAFDNVPPGLPGKASLLAGRVPGGIRFAMRQLRLRPLRRLPMTFGWMAKRPIPDEIMDAWLEPVLGQAEVRRDLRKYVLSAKEGRRALATATERLRDFDRPALVAWASEDRVMPPEHGRRLSELLPQGRLVEIADSYTLIPLDQPGELAAAMREFVREQPRASAGGGSAPPARGRGSTTRAGRERSLP
jgi:pimeloyl-ACP methyl ester carboxylesterase